MRGKSLSAFTEHYRIWCKRKGYNFSAGRAEKIYLTAADLIAVFPKDDNTQLLIRQAVQMLNVASETVESLRVKMNETASQLPKYPVVMGMYGVGPTLGPQLMAEIGDVTRFTRKGAPYLRNLRKTLFQITDGLIKRSPANDPVYAFMDKKHSECKPYYVYMTAGASKFLWIYYGRVREFLSPLEQELDKDLFCRSCQRERNSRGIRLNCATGTKKSNPLRAVFWE